MKIFNIWSCTEKYAGHPLSTNDEVTGAFSFFLISLVFYNSQILFMYFLKLLFKVETLKVKEKEPEDPGFHMKAVRERRRTMRA